MTAQKLEKVGAKSLHVRFSPHGNPLTLWKLAGMHRKQPFDVISTNMEKDIVMGALIACLGKNAQKPIRVTLCGTHADFSQKTRDQWIRKNFGQYFLFPTHYSSTVAKKENPWLQKEQLLELPGPVSTEVFATPGRVYSQKKLVIGCLGRLRQEKNQGVLLRAVAKLPNEVREYVAKVRLGGIGPAVDALRELATNLGIEALVDFPGFIEQPQEFMKTCDIHVLPSKSEAQGLVTLEAMASGAAAIGSNVMGIPETIEHGKTGLLFEDDDEEDLCHQLSKLLVDQRLRETLAQNGLQSVKEKFNADVIARLHLDQYKKLIQNQTSE
jgi:glycosyltransferase involved in cell wall biosynthesis